MKIESVWDYPRPPRLESVADKLEVVLGGETIVSTTKGFRVLETSHPPTYYIPPADIISGALQPIPKQSFCEWKGQARYFDVVGGDKTVAAAAWAYPSPSPAFAFIKDYVAFYAEPMDACFVDGEQVQPQPGNFYGGWVTAKIVGPIKGGPGTFGW